MRFQHPILSQPVLSFNTKFTLHENGHIPTYSSFYTGQNRTFILSLRSSMVFHYYCHWIWHNVFQPGTIQTFSTPNPIPTTCVQYSTFFEGFALQRRLVFEICFLDGDDKHFIRAKTEQRKKHWIKLENQPKNILEFVTWSELSVFSSISCTFSFWKNTTGSAGSISFFSFNLLVFFDASVI